MWWQSTGLALEKFFQQYDHQQCGSTTSEPHLSFTEWTNFHEPQHCHCNHFYLWHTTDDRRDYTEAIEEHIAKRLTQMQKELEMRRTKTEELRKRDEESQQLLKNTLNNINDIFK